LSFFYNFKHSGAHSWHIIEKVQNDNENDMMMLIWGFILLLAVAVIFLVWFQFKQQGGSGNHDVEYQQHLEQKVVHLEENLKKTLEIMQDLAKKMHVQQEAIDKTVKRTHQLELQNAELVSLLSKSVGQTDRPF
jgi:heme/copper-type cytochrome/quinol oxidase subunit 2